MGVGPLKGPPGMVRLGAIHPPLALLLVGIQGEQDGGDGRKDHQGPEDSPAHHPQQRHLRGGREEGRGRRRGGRRESKGKREGSLVLCSFTFLTAVNHLLISPK